MLETTKNWVEQNRWSKEIPQALEKWQIDEICKVLIPHLKPKKITLQVTSYCNYYCPMCPWHGKDNTFKEYYWRENPHLMQKNMPIEMAKEAVDKIVKFGITTIGLVPQGEFFLYPHWEELLAYITQAGARVKICSNGSLLTKETIKKLEFFNIESLTISIDTLDFERFKQIRSDKESHFKNTINAPFLINELLPNLRIEINYVEQEINKGEFEAIFQHYKGVNVYLLMKIPKATPKMIFSKTDLNHSYSIGLCEGFGDYIIQVDGSIVPCCPALAHQNILGGKYNIEKCDLDWAIHHLNRKFIHDNLNGLCLKCYAYRPKYIDETHMEVKNGYLVMHNEMDTLLRISDKISMLPDDVIVYLYQNNIVEKMKLDGIL